MMTERVKRIKPSATCELEGMVEELESSGAHIIRLNAGEPDFQTPENIRNACWDAISAGKTKYVSVAGIMPLRRAIAEKLLKDNGVAYEPRQIVVSTGAKQALYNACMAVCGPGDEVIIPTPCWVSYEEIAKLTDSVPVLVKCKPDFQLDMDAIKRAVTPRTRAVIINTPNNPTGAVYSEDSLRELGNLAVEKGLYVISDEVYEKLVYDGAKHVCIASLSKEIQDRCIIVNGFSKAYAMTGWRIGYCAANGDIARSIISLQGHTTSNSTTFVQWAALEALTGQQHTIEEMRTCFDERRRYLLSRLKAMPGIRCNNAAGAFYLLPDVSAYYGKQADGRVIEDSQSFCAYLLEEAHMAIVPGAAFEAPDTVRIAYSNSIDAIREGMDNMEAALAKLK